MTPREAFEKEALALLQDRVAGLRGSLSYATALALPEAQFEDVVIAKKEVQLTIYRQSNARALPGRVLLTVQLARHALGGTPTYRAERGLVVSPDDSVRDATEQELLDSAR